MDLRILIRAHLYGVAVIGLFVGVLPAYARMLDPRLHVQLPPSLAYAGWPTFLTGGALSYWSFWTLVGWGHGTAFPLDPPQTFVAAGPYRSVRNPMYIGNLGMVAGLALISASAGMLMYALLMCIVTHCYVVAAEEPRLVRRFGADYERYRRRVPRWIPAG